MSWSNDLINKKLKLKQIKCVVFFAYVYSNRNLLTIQNSAVIVTNQIIPCPLLYTGCPIIIAPSVHLSYYSGPGNNYGTPCMLPYW